jgi:hypothetical protein
MDTSMILASYVFKTQNRSGLSNTETLEPGGRNARHVIARLVGVLQRSVSSPSR